MPWVVNIHPYLHVVKIPDYSSVNHFLGNNHGRDKPHLKIHGSNKLFISANLPYFICLLDILAHWFLHHHSRSCRQQCQYFL